MELLYLLIKLWLLHIPKFGLLIQMNQLNEEKYPADVVRGSSAKYTEYE